MILQTRQTVFYSYIAIGWLTYSFIYIACIYSQLAIASYHPQENVANAARQLNMPASQAD